jgi:hypothetical protein
VICRNQKSVTDTLLAGLSQKCGPRNRSFARPGRVIGVRIGYVAGRKARQTIIKVKRLRAIAVLPKRDRRCQPCCTERIRRLPSRSISFG